jgi:Tfp pilus assembly protein PilO
MQIDRPITIAILLFVIVLLIFFIVAPEYRQFRTLQQTVGEKQAEFDAKYAYYAEVAKTYRELESRRDILKKIDDALPSVSSFGRMIYFFKQKGTESGLIVKSIFLSGYSDARPDIGIRDITFSLDVVGNYSALKGFINSLEQSSRLFEISLISFSAPIFQSLSEDLTSTQFDSQQTYTFKLELKANSY